MSLDLHASRLEAYDCIGECACEHSVDAKGKGVTAVWRLCAGSVTRVVLAERRADEHGLVVLAGTSSCSPIDVPLDSLLEAEPGAQQDLGV
jgi:hypothetical protein